MKIQERQRFVPNLVLALVLYLLQYDKETGSRPSLSLKYVNTESFDFCKEFSDYLETCLVSKYNPDRNNTAVEDETEQRLIKELEARKKLIQAEEFTSEEAKKNDLERLDKRIHNISVYKSFRQPFFINKINELKISIPDTNETVLKGLKQYIEAQSKDEIYNPGGSIENWRYLKASFKENIDKTLNLKSYYIENTRYIAVIAYGWLNGSIKINDISFTIDDNKIIDSENPLCFYNEDGEVFFNKDFNGYKFSCSLDLTEFFANKKTPKSQEKISEKELINKKLSEHIQALGAKKRKEVSYPVLVNLIDEIRGKDEKLSSKRYQSYISDVNKYMKDNSCTYILLRKECDCYPIAPLLPKEERGKIHLDSKGKTFT